MLEVSELSSGYWERKTMEKRKKGLTKTPNGDGPKRNKMDFREKNEK